MPKQTYKIESFHGGLNSNADPRDIKDDEASKLQNVKISKLGRLKTSGLFVTKSLGSATTILNNRGLFSYKSDRKLDGTLSNETFLALYDDNDSAIDISDSDGFDDSTITTFDSDLPVFYVGDGNLRVGDGEFDNAVNNKFFGYIEEDRFDGLNADSGSIGFAQSNQAILKPTLGHCLMSTPTAGSDTNGVNSSASEYIGNVAEGAGGDVVDVASVNLRVGFQYNSYRGGNAAYYNSITGAAKEDDDGSGGISVYPLFGDNNIFINGESNTNDIVLSEASSITLTEEKSILFGIWINETNHAKLNEIKFRATESGTSPNTDLTWEFQPDEVKANSWNVFVCNLTSIIEGDATGVGLDSWTLTVTRNATELDFYFSGIVIGTNPSVSGFQPGEYTFHHTYLYDDEKQESTPLQFIDVDSTYNFNSINIVGGSVLFNFDSYINPYNSGGGTYTLSKRITGSRLYYKVQENDNYYLIGEIDFVNKGLKWLPEGQEMAYSMANTSNTSGNFLNKAAIIKGVSPATANLIDTFKTINGYGGSTGHIDAKFKTAVVHGRRTYIGNIRQPSGSDGKNFPDRMLKSMVNKFDVFPDTIGSVDVAINDGESIIKLEGFADRILQFKEKTLYIINISENVDFLEDTLVGKGCAFDYHSIKTDFGIAWFNKFGVYFFDGRQVLNLLEKDGRRLISEDDWETFITDGEQLSTFSSNTVTFSDTHPANTSTLTFQVGSEQTKTIQFLDGAGTNELAFQGDHIADTYVDNFLDSNFAESLCEHVTGIVNSMSNLSATNNGDVMTVKADVASSSKNITIGSSGSHNTTIGTIISGSTGDGSPNDLTTASAHIAYIPRSREIFIKNKNGDSYTYDFVLRAWIKGFALFLDFGNNTNFVLDEDQNLIYFASSNKRKLKWNPDSTSAGSFLYATKDIDFGQPHVKKKIHKLYVSYTSDSAGVVPVYYSVNGDTSLNTVAGAVSGMALSKPQWTVAEYKFNNDAKSCYSIRLQFGSGSAGAGFEINDITIVYRLKNVK